ncbi:TOBE domain-containing protein [Leucobacter denitrificans]|uniref:TOBE domain-containing protein n=1 Tax=Leucobacter denitrificans TaxID=683042 RepID=A0A7G9S209_9MICO|nr:TOBE domain-containing protein [Leucobacter denitrificans]QNN61884.1 TOBE domain-containing protein [Leucobacter denitrificans]
MTARNLYLNDNCERRTISGSQLSESVANRVPGTIDDIVYLGSSVKYNVTTEIGEAVVRVPVERAVDAKIGDAVVVGWATENAVVLVDDEK